MSELVSVILTTYNNTPGLHQSLQSVIKQTYKNLEILVVDGGSHISTRNLINRCKDKRIIYIKVGDENSDNRICGNVQHCRNLGVDLAAGKFVAMLDDDDVWSANKISKQMNLMSMSHASLVVCQTIKMIPHWTTTDVPPSNPSYSDLLQAFNFSQTSAYLMKRKDLIRCGGFNEELRSMHEYDVALRMVQRGHVDVVQEPLLFSYCDNATSRGYYFIKIAELLDLWRTHGDAMLKHLSTKQFFTNVIKTVALVTLYLGGYVVKEKVWKYIFKFKEMYQNEIY